MHEPKGGVAAEEESDGSAILNLLERSQAYPAVFHQIRSPSDGSVRIKPKGPSASVKKSQVIALIEHGGKRRQVRSSYEGRLTYHVDDGQKVKAGTPIAKVEVQDLYVDLSRLSESLVSHIWNVAIASHSVAKGILANMGGGGHVTDVIIPIKHKIEPEKGLESVVEQICSAFGDDAPRDGDVIVVAEKLFAVAQNRLLPYGAITDPDPKKISRAARERLAERYSAEFGMPITGTDLILADGYVDPQGRKLATMGAHNQNRIASRVADRIGQEFDVKVDVVISDTDTGIDVRYPILGCITVGCSPIGSTAGLTLYECMRVACAAEFARGTNKGIPIVICRPRERNRSRPLVGEFRGYDGMLSMERERGIAFA